MAVDKKSNDQQIMQAVLDVSAQALRTVLDESSQITISRTDDSITAFPVSLSESSAVTNADASVALASQPADGVGSLSIYTKTTSTVVSPQVLTVQVSPDNVNWADTTLTITPNTAVVAGEAKYAPPVEIAANYVRVKTAAAIVSGAFTVWLVGGK